MRVIRLRTSAARQLALSPHIQLCFVRLLNGVDGRLDRDDRHLLCNRFVTFVPAFGISGTCSGNPGVAEFKPWMWDCIVPF